MSRSALSSYTTLTLRPHALSRVHALRNILQVKKKKKMASLVEKMDVLACKYIALANLDVSKAKDDPKLPSKLADKFELAHVKSMDEVAVVTRATPVDPSGEYVALTTLLSVRKLCACSITLSTVVISLYVCVERSCLCRAFTNRSRCLPCCGPKTII